MFVEEIDTHGGLSREQLRELLSIMRATTLPIGGSPEVPILEYKLEKPSAELGRIFP